MAIFVRIGPTRLWRHLGVEVGDLPGVPRHRLTERTNKE